jgi:hypothetical protein
LRVLQRADSHPPGGYPRRGKRDSDVAGTGSSHAGSSKWSIFLGNDCVLDVIEKVLAGLAKRQQTHESAIKVVILVNSGRSTSIIGTAATEPRPCVWDSPADCGPSPEIQPDSSRLPVAARPRRDRPIASWTARPPGPCAWHSIRATRAGPHWLPFSKSHGNAGHSGLAQPQRSAGRLRG